MAEEVNYEPGEVLEALNDKLDRDFGNAVKSSVISAIAVAAGLPKVNHLNGEWLFGFYIDESRSDPYEMVQYLKGTDNMLYSPAKMNFNQDKFEIGSWKDAPFMPKPCMLRKDGSVDYYLNPDDYTRKEDGSASDVSNTAYKGNAMVQWPCIYSYHYKEGNRIIFLYSNKKLNDNFECYPCKKADGSYASSFYTPCYEGTIISNTMRSMSTGGKPTCSKTSAQEMTAARANGDGWDVTNQGDEDLIWGLAVMLFKNLNLQVALGYGATAASSASSSALTVNTGACNKKGMFYGTASASSFGIKLFGMEQWYGQRWRRHNGLLLINGVYHVKMTKGVQDGSTSKDFNDIGSGYINTGISAPSAKESYIKQMAVTPYGLLPVAVGGSSTTYYSDGMWSNLSGTMKALRGGPVDNGLLDGVSALTVNSGPSITHWNYGASLSYHL